MEITKERYEKLLYKCIEYLTILWDINNEDMINDYFKDILGFTEEELEYFGIREQV